MAELSYDDARAVDEGRARGHKRGGYMAGRIAKRVNGNVTPDAVKPIDAPKVGEGASIIVHYNDCLGRRGRLLGVLTVVDGRTSSAINVWDKALHDQVNDLRNANVRVVKVETKPSEKWGPSLTKIEAAR